MHTLPVHFYCVSVRLLDSVPVPLQRKILRDDDVIPREAAILHGLEGVKICDMLEWKYIGHTINDMEIRNAARVKSRARNKFTTMDMLMRALCDKHNLQYKVHWEFDSTVIETRVLDPYGYAARVYEDALRLKALYEYFTGLGPRVHVQSFDIEAAMPNRMSISDMYRNLKKYPERHDDYANMCADQYYNLMSTDLTTLTVEAPPTPRRAAIKPAPPASPSVSLLRRPLPPPARTRPPRKRPHCARSICYFCDHRYHAAPLPPRRS